MMEGSARSYGHGNLSRLIWPWKYDAKKPLSHYFGLCVGKMRSLQGRFRDDSKFWKHASPHLGYEEQGDQGSTERTRQTVHYLQCQTMLRSDKVTKNHVLSLTWALKCEDTRVWTNTVPLTTVFTRSRQSAILLTFTSSYRHRKPRKWSPCKLDRMKQIVAMRRFFFDWRTHKNDQKNCLCSNRCGCDR